MDALNLRKLFLYLFLASIGASALVGIAILIFGSFGELEVRVLLTALTVTVTSILGLACGALLETGRGRMIPAAGIFFAVVSAVMWMFVIWLQGNRGDTFVRSLMSITVLAAACAHLSLLSLAKLEKRFAWIRSAAHATIWPLAAFIIFLIWESEWIGEEISGRVTGVLSILVGVVTLMMPIFHWLSRNEATAVAIDAEIADLRAKIAELERKRADLVSGA